MILFDELQASQNQRIDLIRMALNKYSSPYKIEGYDAATLNNLTEFVANNIIYKKRKDYSENDLSAFLYKYAYRYFTQFVTPTSSMDLIEMMVLYNKYMVGNIAENAMANIYGITERFQYNATLVDDPANIGQSSASEYSFSVPYFSNENKADYTKTFHLGASQFTTAGKIRNINTSSAGNIFFTDFELYTASQVDLLVNNVKVAQVAITLVEKVSEFVENSYASNLLDNMTADLTKIIDAMTITAATATWLHDKEVINDTTDATVAAYLLSKQTALRNSLEVIKANNTLKNIIIHDIDDYAQNTTETYLNTITGYTTHVSKLAYAAASHVYNEIRYTGMEVDDIYRTFKNSTNMYTAYSDATDRDALETFFDDLFIWKNEIDSDTRSIDFTISTSLYYNSVDDASTFVTYTRTMNETFIMHLYVYLYKYFILMDIKVLDADMTAEKDKAVNTYEINQISESKPINYINVVHPINDDEKKRIRELYYAMYIDEFEGMVIISDSGYTAGTSMVSLTFQYKELNKDVYDLFLQDQVETYIANWLAKNRSITYLFDSIYMNGYNESVLSLATNTPITLHTLNKVTDPTYFTKVKTLVGNTINFREKEYMDIAGYFFNSFDGIYYGVNSEHKQEIALFIRCFQDVRDYYFKNILLKSLVNDDEYPLYEYILIVTMALDRYFSKKVSKHKDLDAYSTEDINNFLDSFGLSELNNYDSFYGSFDYKMSVIRNYNNLIKNKGTRKVRTLIENMLNTSSDEYKISINEYYIAKSTKESINYVTEWYYDGHLYVWDGSVGHLSWDPSDVYLAPYDDLTVWVTNVPYVWYDVEKSIKYTSIKNTDESITTTTEIVNTYTSTPAGIPAGSPETIGAIQYNKDNDVTLFINVPEGTDRPITTIKNKVDANTTIDYDKFTEDDLYWSKDITQAFINDATEGLNLNTAKTKYLSISASINMEVAKIMNMYVMSVLDNFTEKTNYDMSIESYADDFISVSDISYTNLIKYIKFITMHLGDVLSPWAPASPDTTTGMKYYGVSSLADLPTKLATFETELKSIVNGISSAEIEEFMYDNIATTVNGTQTSIMSMNRYAYEDTIEDLSKVTGIDAFITTRKDVANINNSFTDKLRTLLLGFAYSADFQNSATFIIDFLESTNLLSIMEENGSTISYTEAKYLKLLTSNSTISPTINIGDLYSINVRSLLQMLKDYTENKIFKEDYVLKDSSVINRLAINNAFIRILELIISTFFERHDSIYLVSELETILTEETHTTPFEALPDFMQEFIELLRQETISQASKDINLPKYNSILTSLNTILSYMTAPDEFELLTTVNTVNKNFSNAEYLNFLISLLSFFMSYKVTMYEESHQLDLSNPKETFIFAEDLLIWSELNLEEDWFFDEEILEM